MTPHPLTAAAARRRVITGASKADVVADVAAYCADKASYRIHMTSEADGWQAVVDSIEGDEE